jgi:hypothetical protein
MNFQLRKILKTIFKIIGVLNKVAFICILTIGLSSAAGNNNSSWSTLRVGTQIYTGSDGMGVITQTVCPSIDAWHTYLDGTTTACRLHIPRGTPAIVNSIIPSSPDDIDSNGGGPYVELKALDGSWSGYSLAMVLKPDVPTGITITFDNKSDNQEHFTLDKNPSSSFNLGQDLGNKVTVKLLKYAPNEFRTLYVTVVE